MTATLVPHEPAPMTAARRSGGRPPSHSHCSMTLGQMRSVTAAASCGEAFSTFGKCSGRPIRIRTLCGRIRHPLRTDSVPITATGTTGAPVSSARRPTPRLGRPSAPGRVRVPSGNISTQSPRSRIALAVVSMSASPAPRLTGKAPSELRNQATRPVAEDLPLGDVVQRPPRDRADHERVEERPVVRGEDDRARRRDVLAPDARHPEVEVEERLQHRARSQYTIGFTPRVARLRVDVAMVGSPGLSLTAVPARTPLVTVCLQHGLRPHSLPPRRARREPRRGRLARSAAAGQARLRRRLRRRRAARPACRPRTPRRERDRHLPAPAERGPVRRRLRRPGPEPSGAAGPAWPARRPGRAPGHLARHGDRRAPAVGQRPRVRSGHLAPPALRLRPRRARATAQPARRRARAAGRDGRCLQRPRVGRAPRGHRADR